MTVRLAKYGDEEKMYDTIVQGHADNGLWPLAPMKIVKLIQSAVLANKAAQEPVIGIIEGENGEIEAMTCMQLETFWYTDEWHIAELFNWVHPDHRSSRHAQELMEFQRRFSDNMTKLTGKKIALITGVMSIKRLEAKMNLFARKYPQIGALYAYNLDIPEDSFNQRRLSAPTSETVQ